ncbi:MAG: hypothetical protein KJ970_09175 [Candidatus Eisenbacteria bacterium]|uniref:ATP synthase subunit I n=1 Tax=Eiseniibacteriota bacterium TaxID=2212470 RepID=A0A948W633_UNCEI|nr:hypothetical protein [Candidatus Eisenbacteria bacterium]MBU1949994.1 hypothetical protein [Candidatus Eisenbacteria bacterium]MBU2691089.1 hypothetical protein [Candidatus Eisenbacteria bacterium]
MIRDQELDPAFIRRTVLATMLTGIIVALAAWAYKGPAAGGGCLAGAVLGAANLWFLWNLIHMVLAPVRGSNKAIVVAVFLKVGLVYGAGAALLIWGKVSAIWFLIGFTLLFVVLVLKVAGRWITSDENKGRSIDRPVDRSG